MLEDILDIFNQRKENKSLTSLIFEKVREDILDNKYKNGEKIVEAKLAEELGVSRTPVREALKQLELDGLVDNIPNRGVIVKGISYQDLYDIYTIRVFAEGIAAKWAVERMDDGTIDELKEIYELMEFYTYKNDTSKLFELSTKFNRTIYTASKSRYLEQILKDFQLFISRARSESIQIEGRPKLALKEYEEILNAFINRDAEAASIAVKNHISNALINSKKVSNLKNIFE